MLSKEKCIKAIEKWIKTRSKFSKLNELIQPTAVFSFTRKQCDWLNEHNENQHFHTYMGIHSSKLAMIVVPLDTLGEELDLPNYVVSYMEPMVKSLDLVEEKIIKKTRTISLSTNLALTNRQELVELPFKNEPELGIEKSLRELSAWKKRCLDWMYNESMTAEGKNIFKSFTVPLGDLAKENENIDRVICLFGFRYSTVYNKDVPVLIFAAVNGRTQQAALLEADEDNDTSTVYDFDSPCPPFCRHDFGLD